MPQLELPVDELGGNMVGDSAAHCLNLRYEVFPIRRGPHHRAYGLQITAAELDITSDRAGFEQRLELPSLRPPAVVGQVPFQRAHQRAGFALRAQRRVDLETR